MKNLLKILPVLLTASLLFFSCGNPSSGNNNIDPNPGRVRGLEFSHKSGIYNNSFDLTLTSNNSYEIYYSIDGSVPSKLNADDVRVFKYTSPINIQNRTGLPNFLATNANIPLFYPSPYEDRIGWTAPVPHIPIDSDARPKAMVIRAVAVDSNGAVKSDVATLTYFIGNMLADYAGHPVISIVTDPKNLLDADTGIYVRGHGITQYDYNFYKKGREWEREANIDFFDASRRLAFSTGAGIRIRGGWSRDVQHKSWNIYFRQEYGIDNLVNYPLIPGAVHINGRTPITRNKNIMLRNGGNDADITKLRDVFVQSLLTDRNFTTQAAIPCMAYLNGEYWGFYNLQERYSNHYLENKFGVNRNNVIIIENWDIDEGSQAEFEDFTNRMYYFGTLNMTNQNNYKEFSDFFDITSYIDYFAANIYIGNQDWPDNNWQLWRTRNKEPNNPYGDQRWRWQMFDTEMSMSIYNDGRPNDFYREKILGTAYHHATQVFIKLLENEEFFKQFIITLMDLSNVNFEYSSSAAKLDELAAVYKPLMAEYNSWFGYSWKTFDAWIFEMKSFLFNIKDAVTKEYLPVHFGSRGITAANLKNVNLYAKYSDIIMNSLPIKINTTAPNPSGGIWTGKYYSIYPVTVTAEDIDGYTFANWTVQGGSIISGNSAGRSITVSFNNDINITANYNLTGGQSIVNVSGVTLNRNSLSLNAMQTGALTAAVIPANATFKTLIWTSSNEEVATVDPYGRINAHAGGTAVVKVTTVQGNYSAQCTVTVIPIIKSAGIHNDWKSLDLVLGEEHKLSTWTDPWDAPNKKMKWYSSNSNIASVSADGTVKAVGTGQAVITVVFTDGNVSGQRVINIRNGTVLLDLSKVLKEKERTEIKTSAMFNNIFAGVPIRSGGNIPGEINYEIINEDNLNKLKINIISSSAGIDISGISFQIGDQIEVKGTVRSNTKGEMILGINNSNQTSLNNWKNYVEEWWSFEDNIYINDQSALNMINSNQGIRLKMLNTGNYTLHIEQIKVTRF